MRIFFFFFLSASLSIADCRPPLLRSKKMGENDFLQYIEEGNTVYICGKLLVILLVILEKTRKCQYRCSKYFQNCSCCWENKWGVVNKCMPRYTFQLDDTVALSVSSIFVRKGINQIVNFLSSFSLIISFRIWTFCSSVIPKTIFKTRAESFSSFW